VTKLNASGSALVYSTYLGGSGSDFASGIAVDAAGDAYVTGETSSEDFPVRNALQPTLRGATERVDAFVTKLGPTGALVYSTYLGGSQEDAGSGIAVDGAGRAYVTGATTSTDFPLKDPVQASCAPSLGSSGRCPEDVFVVALDAQGSELVYSTYLGGAVGSPGFPPIDAATGIAVDRAGNAYITGVTISTDFPTLHAVQPAYGGGGQDALITKLAAVNSPPECTAATATPGTLWPPNHRLVLVAIQGVTDPDGDPVTIQITGITQDEPLSGNTPDATGLGSATAQVRAERAGGADGRVYHLTFTATDSQGASCAGTVTVCVPHDQGGGRTCGDGGALYSSTGSGR
jgi:hypothetical protein